MYEDYALTVRLENEIATKIKNINRDRILQRAIEMMKLYEKEELENKGKYTFVRIHTTDRQLAKEFEKECKRTGCKEGKAISIAVEDILDENGML